MRARDLLAVAGGQQDRQLREAVADLAGKLDAADAARHYDVGEDELGLFASGEPVESFLGAVRDDRLEAQFVQHARGEFSHQSIVFDDENLAESMHAIRLALRGGRTAARGEVKRE